MIIYLINKYKLRIFTHTFHYCHLCHKNRNEKKKIHFFCGRLKCMSEFVTSLLVWFHFHKSHLSDVKSKSCRAIFVFMTINFIELSYYSFKLKRLSYSQTEYVSCHRIFTSLCACVCVRVRSSKDRRNSTPKLANIGLTTVEVVHNYFMHVFSILVLHMHKYS